MGNTVLLKVGELARRSGLTVRTLHHYDEIGLVRPSARTEAGYRLYDERDVARLHAVQALRQLGFGLARIAELLAAEAMSPQRIVAEQIRALDEEIVRARELRAQLVLLQEALATGAEPQPAQWLSALALMSAWRRHFSPRELRPLIRRWRQKEAGWQPLLDEVQAAMRQEIPPDSPQAQALAQRWMDMAMELTEGDLALALRWARMNEEEPGTAVHQGTEPRVLAFIGRAIELRMQALQRHLSAEEIRRLDTGLARRWRALVERAQTLMACRDEPPGEGARSLLADWDRLVGEMTRQDPALQARLQQAYRCEPLLRHGHVVTPQVRAYVEGLRAHFGG